MRTILVLGVAAFLAAPVGAHSMSEHGNITVMTLGTHPVLHEVFGVLGSVLPGSVPNGLAYYAIHGVQSGDEFSVVADDGQEPMPWCHPDPHPFLPCLEHPDFDVYCGGHRNVPGDEYGTVDCGACVVYLVFGDVGEGFSYSET